MWHKKRLLALGYPIGGAESFDITNTNHIQTLVAWLEDTKIRFYKIDDRLPLRTMDANWLATFREYIQQLGCPHPLKESLTTTDWIVLVDWLLAHAVGLVYRDNVISINEKARKQLENQQTTKIPTDTSDYNSAEFKAALTELTTLLNIPMHEDPAILLSTIQKTVNFKFSKGALAIVAGSSSPSVSSLHSDTSIDNVKFPLGFQTGESGQTDTASTLLRLLYIQDLRHLQTNINQLIAAVQGLTANPRTNTELGKVGR